MERGTVKDLMDTLDDMRKVYRFADDKTVICVRDNGSYVDGGGVYIATTDEETGVSVEMRKSFAREG